ncbi:MAG: thioredoxin family protein [Phycisphaeraceae bacterium]|nr:thioredoxin family protein [Phycisphaeraceae bacterium]
MNRIVACVLVLFAVAICRADLPPAFSDVTLDAAKKQVQGTDKVVVIKFTAEWCPPCKVMDRTTWRDDKVIEWVKSHGVALQVDVDKDQKTAMAYNIEAMPTMVMLRSGKEIARTLGYMDPTQTISWMESAATGKAVTAAPAKAKADPSDTPVLRLMSSLDKSVEEGKFTDALSIVREMFAKENASDPLRQIGLVAEVHPQLQAILKGAPDAKQAFASIRDEIENAPVEPPSIASNGPLNDWFAWNSILDDDARSLAWLEHMKGERNGAAWIDVGFAGVAPLLYRHRRAAEIAEVLPGATDALKRRHQQIVPVADGLSKPDPSAAARMWADFETLGAQIFAGNVAAKKIREANEIAETMLQFRDTPTMRVALVQECVETGVLGPGMNLWLDEAQKSGQDVGGLKKQVEALRKP